MREKIAKIIRIATVPQIMALGLLVLLYFGRDNVFFSLWEMFWTVFFLMILPIASYPLSWLIPRIKEKGRDGERGMAFVLCFYRL